MGITGTKRPLNSMLLSHRVRQEPYQKFVRNVGATLRSIVWYKHDRGPQQLHGRIVCLTHWGRDKMDAISQTTFSNAFSWTKMLEYRLKFGWSLFLRVYRSNAWIPIKISLKFVPQGPINNILALVQIMAWRRPGDKPLSGPMMVSLSTHICITRPQWVKQSQQTY